MIEGIKAIGRHWETLELLSFTSLFAAIHEFISLFEKFTLEKDLTDFKLKLQEMTECFKIMKQNCTGDQR